jgi:broad specificity phosphatase PhoE
MTKLIVIKHSQPEIVADVPAPRWVLSDVGRQRCDWLGRSLRAHDLTGLGSSLEPKALETAARVAVANSLVVMPHAGLHENDRTGLGFLPEAELRDRIRKFFAEPDRCVMGRETAHEAFARLAEAVAEIEASMPKENIAIVTHGTVLTLFVSRHNKIAPFDLWTALRAPSYVVLDGPARIFDGSVHDFTGPEAG